MQALEDILRHASRGVLSLTGGGGKTSLMFHLARRLSRAGLRVLTTTTTKIFVPTAEQSATVLVDADPQTILRQAASCPLGGGHLTAAAGHLADTGKLQGFAPQAIEHFAASGLFDCILVEADGAGRRPLKAAAEHEPVVPACTTVQVAVAGLEVLGAPFGPELVFRAELAGPLLGLVAGETITPAALARLFAHPRGAFKGAPPRVRRFIFLNKADTPERRAAGEEFVRELRRLVPCPAEAVLIGRLLGDEPSATLHSLAGVP